MDQLIGNTFWELPPDNHTLQGEVTRSALGGVYVESLTRVKLPHFDPGQKNTCVYMRKVDRVTSLKILCFTLSHTSGSLAVS